MRRVVASRAWRRAGFAAWTGGAVAVGYAMRSKDEELASRKQPMGWRACCDGKPLTVAQEALRPKLREIVGAAHVVEQVEQKGSRLGAGVAFAVVKPGSLQEALDCLQACVDADCCVVGRSRNPDGPWPLRHA